ncbi:MAG: GreA/GreB family elongation factor [Gemmatimonadota bacterium]
MGPPRSPREREARPPIKGETTVLDRLRERLSEESERLLHELKVVLPAEIERAVGQGDLRENSEYSAALERQQLVRARLDHISRRLSELAEIDLEQIPADRVGFGSQVRVIDLDGRTEESFTLAFGDYIDFDKSEISMASPIGRALLGRRVGEEVTVTLPGGSIRYRITAFMTLHDLVGPNGDGKR